MKTGTHPMISKLKLYFKWGIKFSKPFQLFDKGARRVCYAERDKLIRAIEQKYPQSKPVPPDEFIPEDSSFADKRGKTIKTGN